MDALIRLSGIRDAKLFIDTLAEVLARERDTKVLEAVFEMAAQQGDPIRPEVLRSFLTSDRDGTARAMAVELLAVQDGDQPSTRALLRSLAVDDASAPVRDAAKTALEILDAPPAPPAPAPTRGRSRL